MTPEEGTVGKICTTDSECEVADAVGDEPVLGRSLQRRRPLQHAGLASRASATIGGNTIADLLCDDGAGYCYAAQGQSSGTCLPFCAFTSTEVISGCEGNNKCAIDNAVHGYVGRRQRRDGDRYLLRRGTMDADRKRAPARSVTRRRHLCPRRELRRADEAAGRSLHPAGDVDGGLECNCDAIGGTGADKLKGSAATAARRVPRATRSVARRPRTASVKCTAGLPTELDGAQWFNNQPTEILGTRAQPCDTDDDCTFTVGAAGETCTTVGGGKFCFFPRSSELSAVRRSQRSGRTRGAPCVRLLSLSRRPTMMKSISLVALLACLGACSPRQQQRDPSRER